MVADTDALTNTLRAVGDPTRRTILDLLKSGGRSVTDLAKHFSMSRPAVSKHLGILRAAGLVTARREGRQQIYELDSGPLGPVGDWLERHRQPAKSAPAAPSPTRQVRRPARQVRRPARQGEGWRCW